MDGPGNLDWHPWSADLVAEPVAAARSSWPYAADLLAAPIDPDMADTAAFCERYGVELSDSANCVVIAGRRSQQVSYAACLVLATTRADVNGVVRRRLGARRASFAPMDDAVTLTAMEYGGITAVGLPPDWPILIDTAVLERDIVVIGSGLRRSKLAIATSALPDLPGAELVAGLAA